MNLQIPDGFVPLEASQLGELALNANFIVDEFSPFADHQSLATLSTALIVDRYFGQIYRGNEPLPTAIYGKTVDLPSYSGDHLANDGFLRVPFRRIPRRIVPTRREIEAILASITSADDNLRILLRGQTRQYVIRRSVETTRWVYGEDTVL